SCVGGWPPRLWPSAGRGRVGVSHPPLSNAAPAARPCGGRVCAYIGVHAILSIYDGSFVRADNTTRGAAADFRCQFPADRVLVRANPLPGNSRNGIQAIDIRRLFATKAAIFGCQTGV